MSSLSGMLQRVYQTVVAGSFFLLPLIFIPLAWTTIPHAKITLVALCFGLGFAAFAMHRFFEGSVSFPKSLTIFLGALIPVAYLLSGVFSDNPRTSILGAGAETDTAIAVLLWWGLLFLTASVLKTRPQIMGALAWLVAAAGVAGVFQVVRLILGPGSLSFGGVFTDLSASVVGGWHDFGIFLGLATFLSLALLLHTTDAFSRSWRLVFKGVAILSTLLLIVINVRDVWIALAVLSALAILHYFMSNRSNVAGFKQNVVTTAKTASLFVALLVCSIVLVAFGDTVHNALPESLRIVQLEIRPSWQGTLAVTAQTYTDGDAFLGSGPNTFTRQWGLYKPAGVNETAFWNADFAQGIGFIPTAFITVGILGVLVWVLFLVALLYEGIRASLKTGHDLQKMVIGIFAAVVYLWIVCIVYAPGVTLLALTFLMTGLFLALSVHIGSLSSINAVFKGIPRKEFSWSVGLVVVSVASLLVMGLVGRTVIADAYVNRSVTIYNKTQNTVEAQQILEKALALDSTNDRAHRAAIELAVLQIAELAKTEGEEAEKIRDQLTATVSAAIQHGLEAVNDNSANYQNWLALARIYEQLVGARVEGAYEQARLAYERALEANPTNPLMHLRLAQLSLAQDNKPEALQYLQASLALKPNFAPALFLLTQLEADAGNADAALNAARATVAAAPQEPVAWFQLGALLFQGGAFKDAAAVLQQAVTLNGNYANALYVLGLSFAQLGEYNAAEKAFTRVLDLNPGNKNIEAIIAELKQKNAPAIKSGSEVAEPKAVESDAESTDE
ncbi:MAG: tetratricopeptide repeat protein [Patescibacteria group bacterium]